MDNSDITLLIMSALIGAFGVVITFWLSKKEEKKT